MDVDRKIYSIEGDAYKVMPWNNEQNIPAAGNTVDVTREMMVF